MSDSFQRAQRAYDAQEHPDYSEPRKKRGPWTSDEWKPLRLCRCCGKVTRLCNDENICDDCFEEFG